MQLTICFVSVAQQVDHAAEDRRRVADFKNHVGDDTMELDVQDEYKALLSNTGRAKRRAAQQKRTYLAAADDDDSDDSNQPAKKKRKKKRE